MVCKNRPLGLKTRKTANSGRIRPYFNGF